MTPSPMAVPSRNWRTSSATGSLSSGWEIWWPEGAQRLKNWPVPHPSDLATATPGDLSFVFPYRHLVNIIEMLQALDKLVPGIFSRDTLLYGVEVKFYSNRIEMSSECETRVANLFAIGDGAGITRGLLQASVSGIMAGRAIGTRIKSLVMD